MTKITHKPVLRAMERLKELSADEETRRLAFVRERALRDEVSVLNDAKTEGRKEGQYEARQEAALNLIKRTEMDDQMIAEIAGLPVEEVNRLRFM